MCKHTCTNANNSTLFLHEKWGTSEREQQNPPPHHMAEPGNRSALCGWLLCWISWSDGADMKLCVTAARQRNWARVSCALSGPFPELVRSDISFAVENRWSSAFSSAEPGSWYQPQRRKRRKRKKLLYKAYCDNRATGICLSIIWCPIAGRAALPQSEPNLVGWFWQPVRLVRTRLWQNTLKCDAEPSCLCFLGTYEPGIPEAQRDQQDVFADLLHVM